MPTNPERGSSERRGWGRIRGKARGNLTRGVRKARRGKRTGSSTGSKSAESQSGMEIEFFERGLCHPAGRHPAFPASTSQRASVCKRFPHLLGGKGVALTNASKERGQVDGDNDLAPMSKMIARGSVADWAARIGMASRGRRCGLDSGNQALRIPRNSGAEHADDRGKQRERKNDRGAIT